MAHQDTVGQHLADEQPPIAVRAAVELPAPGRHHHLLLGFRSCTLDGPRVGVITRRPAPGRPGFGGSASHPAGRLALAKTKPSWRWIPAQGDWTRVVTPPLRWPWPPARGPAQSVALPLGRRQACGHGDEPALTLPADRPRVEAGWSLHLAAFPDLSRERLEAGCGLACWGANQKTGNHAHASFACGKTH